MASSRLLSGGHGARCFRLLLRPLSTKSPAKSAAKLRPDPYDNTHESIYTAEHAELREAFRKFIDKEINPFVDEWEKAKMFPAHELFKKLGTAGYLGVNKPVGCGGQGLDYSYSVAIMEELGMIKLPSPTCTVAFVCPIRECYAMLLVMNSFSFILALKIYIHTFVAGTKTFLTKS